MDALDKEADGRGVKGVGGETVGVSLEGEGLLEKLEGRRLRVTGVFDHSKEVLVGELLLIVCVRTRPQTTRSTVKYGLIIFVACRGIMIMGELDLSAW